jgi:RNA polymerase sigma-70 factor (ECF subfamily)
MSQTNDYTSSERNEDAHEGLMHQEMSLLLQQCINNDRRAQRNLFNYYKIKVHDLVFKSLGPKFDTDDVLQQVFIELFKSLSYFKGDSSLDTWVYRICVKVCTTQLRKKYRKRQPQIVYDTEQTELEADKNSQSPYSDMEQKELEAVVYSALDKLDADKRMTVVMYEIDGKSLEEIAETSKIPIGTVKSRLFHGRKALEKLLRRHLDT